MIKSIKYHTTKICFQEIPDEISFTYFLTNCPNRCPECHSPHLREDTGTPVISTIEEVLKTNKNRCSCILFMGGDDPAQIDSLIECLKICKQYDYKTALYSGFEFTHAPKELLKLLDYIKVGRYVSALGGLNSKQTNQRLYKLTDGSIEKNLTNMFWRRLDEDKSM